MSDATEYTPPKVWTWNKPSGGRFANINRPISGATHEKELPVGRHPAAALFAGHAERREGHGDAGGAAGARAISGAEYDAWLIRIGEGDQFGSGFVAINPNSKIPALVDRSGPKPIRVFETGAILVHLAEKFGAFLPTEPGLRAECLSWLFWQMGSTPYVGGGFGHFYAYAPVKIEYAIDRFAMETKRLLDVLDKRLAENEYLAGDVYTIADMAAWPWYGGLVKFGPVRRGRVPVGARIQERHALGGCDLTRGRRCSGGGWSTACRANRRASCTSAMTPAISKRRRRTSWRPIERDGAAALRMAIGHHVAIATGADV